MIIDTTKTRKITKVLPGLKANYELVSLSESAWDWLDDYMHFFEMRDYPELLNDFKDCIAYHENLSEVLENIAAVHEHFVTQLIYNLENDNDPYDDTLPHVIRNEVSTTRRKEPAYAKAVKLFGFMPHATRFDAVITRQQKSKKQF